MRRSEKAEVPEDIIRGSKAERPENVRAHVYTQTPKTQPHGFDWRIHCGVEVTELSTNKQHTLSPISHRRVGREVREGKGFMARVGNMSRGTCMREEGANSGE
jgi:hypothetical protein